MLLHPLPTRVFVPPVPGTQHVWNTHLHPERQFDIYYFCYLELLLCVYCCVIIIKDFWQIQYKYNIHLKLLYINYHSKLPDSMLFVSWYQVFSGAFQVPYLQNKYNIITDYHLKTILMQILWYNDNFSKYLSNCFNITWSKDGKKYLKTNGHNSKYLLSERSDRPI